MAHKQGITIPFKAWILPVTPFSPKKVGQRLAWDRNICLIYEGKHGTELLVGLYKQRQQCMDNCSCALTHSSPVAIGPLAWLGPLCSAAVDGDVSRGSETSTKNERKCVCKGELRIESCSPITNCHFRFLPFPCALSCLPPHSSFHIRNQIYEFMKICHLMFDSLIFKSLCRVKMAISQCVLSA